MNIIIGSDHRGFDLKNLILEHLKTDVQVTMQDIGAFNKERSNYPIFAHAAANKIKNKEADYAILICGSGVGMSIAANRHVGIYAALCWSSKVAKVAYEDDNTNILVLSSDFISDEENLEIVKTIIKAWKNKIFKGGIYQDRIDMIDNG